MATDFVELASEIEPIVRETRLITLPHFGTAALRETKEDLTVVTQLDIEVEEFLIAEFSSLLPEAGSWGEEHGRQGSQELYFTLDPIDGTEWFMRGVPFCSTMWSLIEDGRVQAAGIYDFVHDEYYSAVRDHGAFRDGEPLAVSDRPLSRAMVHLESTDGDGLLQPIRRKGCGLFNSINCGFEFSLVASGRIEGRIMHKPFGYIWDFAPGSLLVEEAGGVVANIGSREFDPTNLEAIAANPIVFRELTEGEAAVFPIVD